MDSRNCGYCEFCAIGNYKSCASAAAAPEKVTKEDLIKAIEVCHADIFSQCCSNPVTNAWGEQVNLASFNEMYLLAFTARKELDNE